MNNAFNPYRSFVITASAGSGKTYQLVQRYLYLASVLADGRLSRVLTVTFTRKAAAEMQQRIIESAADLLTSPDSRRELEEDVKGWSGGKARPSAVELANLILRNSQSMRVVTMDSLFSWLAGRFSMEAGLPVGAEIADESQISELYQTAWFRLLNRPECRENLEQAAFLVEGELQVIRGFLEGLYRVYRPTIYSRFEGRGEELEGSLLLEEDDRYDEKMLERDIWGWLKRLLAEEAWVSKRDLREEVEGFQKRRDFPGLLSSPFFKPAKASWPGGLEAGVNFSVNLTRLPRPLKEWSLEADACLERFTRVRRVKSYNRLIGSLLGLYGEYERIMGEIKQEAGLVDFADISVAAFKLLQDPGIAFTLQSGIQHLLIDEFQDTSNLQWEFFRPVMEELLSGGGIFDDQTFFGVGDIKQSIYGFREADYTLLEGLASEASSSPVLSLLSLHRSHRSSPLIIDFVNAAFGKSSLPSFEEHQTEIPPLGGAITVYPLIEKGEGTFKKADRWRLDAVRVAESIEALVAKQVPVAEKVKGEEGVEYRRRPAAYGDIAVIYRKKNASAYLEAELARRGIPCRREETGGFYERREVQDILALLDLLSDPADNLALATVLRSPLIGVPEEELATLLAGSGRGRSLWKVFQERGEKELARVLRETVDGIGRRPLSEVVESFFQAADVRLAYRVSTGDELPLLNLDKVIDLLATLSARGVASIRECRRVLDKMSEEDETRMAGEAENCVRLMTVHKAKGLEFKVLYLFDAAFTLPRIGGSSNFVLLRRRDPDRPPLVYFPPSFCLPDGHPAFDSWKEEAELEAEEEEMRILYVALTRASQYLFVSGVEPGGKSVPFYKRILEGALKVAGEGRWERATVDHAGQLVEVALRDPTTLPELEKTEPPAVEKVDESIFRPDGWRKATVFLRPSAADKDEEEPDRPGLAETMIPEKFRALGLAVHKAMELKCCGGDFSPAPFLDRLMERSHPDRSWVEEELAKDLRAMEESNFTARVEGAELKTEVSVLNYLSGDGGADRIVTGVVDLLAIYPDRVDFYDYKTTRLKPGGEPREVKKYRPQMELYLDALREIFPKQVTGYLVFTSTGKVVKLV